ncbi:uncharacterized protein G2W53_009587 [Senna tora]|uniref:Uncharacterized protein n=1 Tax=Senna tora TaxID=362788 RepID=A0A834WYE0_9FABA|nr:uncharacterized protein G2W53_009587 [Senna tora]
MNQSGFDAPIGVVLASEERGSCLNIFRTTNRGRISETFTNYEVKDLFGSESNTSVRVVFTNGSGFDAPIGVVLAWEELSQTRRFANRSGFDAPNGVILAWEKSGSCLTIFRTTNLGRISETFMNYEAKDLLRTNLNKLRGKRLVAQVSQTRRFVNQSGFDAPIRVVLAWEERGSCLNIFRTTNHDRISETFTNYEAKDLLHNRLGMGGAWICLNIFRTTNRGRISETFTNNEAKDLLRKSVDQVLTYSGRQIAVGSQKPSRITRQKTCCASESNTSVRVVFANGSGFDAPIGVVWAWEERGSCLNIFRTTNHGQISETFTNYEAKDLLRKSVDHVLTYSGRQITVRSQKPSEITRQKTCCASESNTSVRVVFANRSGFDAPIGVVLAWEERGSCLNIFGRQIAVGSQKPSRITRQKTCCASESNTSVRVVFANRSGFDAPIGVVLAWEERGSCLNIFRTTKRGRISETFTNYEAKDSLRQGVKHVDSRWIRESEWCLCSDLSRLGMGRAWIMS